MVASAALALSLSLSLGACSSSAVDVSPDAALGPGPDVDAGGVGLTDGSSSSSDGASRDGGSAGDGGDAIAPTCAADASPGTHTGTCEGFAVSVTVPSTCPAAGCGLILDLHGALMSGDLEDSHTELRKRGGALGFAVVQPTAPTRTYSNLSGPQWFNADDDALHRLVLGMIKDLSIDPTRVHATGFSQGGFAVLRLLCKHADTFASVAPGNAGIDGCPLDANVIAGCPMTGANKASRPIDVLFLYGRKDAIVPQSCAEQAVAAIASGFGLAAPQTLGSSSSYARKQYQSSSAPGSDAMTMVTLEHDYVTSSSGALALNKGHCVPGSKANTGTLWDDLACSGSNAFTWGEEVANFFAAHPRPQP